MAELHPDQKALLNRIEAAFTQEYPGDDHLVDYSDNVD